MTKLRIAALLALLAPAACDAEQVGVEEAVLTITAEDFAWKVGVIAHDSMGGRNTPSIGLDRTAEWAASEFRRLGLRGGAAEGSFIQRYPLRSVAVDAEASSIEADGVTLSFGVDVLPVRGRAESAVETGEVVIVSGSTGDMSARADQVRGRHVILVPAAGPQPMTRDIFQRTVTAGNAGAASVWLVSSADDAAWDAAAARWLRPTVSKAWGEDFQSPPGQGAAPAVQIRRASLERLLAGADVDLAALEARATRPLRFESVPGLSATLRHVVRTDEITAPNVVAVLDGSDPEMRAEHVVFSGHIDHVGTGTPDENGDSIFNGADDDASGTVAVLEIAEAMVALGSPPKRSMVFLLVSGEEKGLWGSEWFADNPTVPIDQFVANLNTDMVGRNWPDTIVAIGKEHSDLGRTLNRVNAAHPELRMTAIDDLWPDERFYFRSDHFNFARKGVPILFFFNGTHDDYHGRDDETDRIDTEKAARIARLVFYLGLEVGDAPDRPRWNPESYARIVSDDMS